MTEGKTEQVQAMHPSAMIARFAVHPPPGVKLGNMMQGAMMVPCFEYKKGYEPEIIAWLRQVADYWQFQLTQAAKREAEQQEINLRIAEENRKALGAQAAVPADVIATLRAEDARSENGNRIIPPLQADPNACPHGASKGECPVVNCANTRGSLTGNAP